MIYLLIFLLGVKTQSWRLESYEDFIEGEPEKVSITSEGFLKLSPELAFSSEIPETYIFSLVEDKKGNIYCGTGEKGRVYKINKNGECSIFFDTKETGVLSLAIGPNGYLYCGTTPQGYIYEVSPKGRGRIFFKTKEKYVWNLLFDKKTLYAATGVEGKIYKISSTGKGKVIHTSEDSHIMTLAGNKSLFCGTSGSGLVYKITDGNAMSIYDVSQVEVHSLVLGKDGNLYLGCVPESTEASVEVYKIDTSGVLYWSRSLQDSLLLSMVMDEKYGLVVGTGHAGKVYSFPSGSRPSLLIELEESEILSLYSDKHLLLGTASPCKVYSLEGSYAREGEYLSEVIDAGTIVKWGRIEGEIDKPSGTQVILYTRSGNSEEPDKTWGDWEEVNNERIESLSSRFLQWKAVLSTKNPKNTPVLNAVSIWYLPTNLQPVIEWVNLSEEEEISWYSWDPNQDSLVADLYFKGVEEKNWKILKEEIRDSVYTLNTQALPDGKYEIKLIVSDRLNNPKELAFTAEKLTRPFIIDNTPPEISEINVKKIRNYKYRIEFKAEDKLSVISAAFYSLNAGEWHPISPKDIIFDSPSKEFSFNIDIESGEWVLVVRVEDEKENIGTRKTIIMER